MEGTGNVYCGRRNPMGSPAEVYRNGKAFGPETSLKVRRHSPAGFNFGYCGSGPAQLALALLLDAVKSRRTAETWYQDFKAQVVSGWGQMFAITQAEILQWLHQARIDNVCRKEREDNATQETDRERAGRQATPAEGQDAGVRTPLLAETPDQPGQ